MEKYCMGRKEGDFHQTNLSCSETIYLIKQTLVFVPLNISINQEK